MKLEMRKVATQVFFYALVGGGIGIGYALSRIGQFDGIKLLAVIGIAYQLLGIAVLSETVRAKSWALKIVADWMSGTLLWANTIMPIFAAITSSALVIAELAGFAAPGDYPSARIVAQAALSFSAWSILPLAFLSFYVVERARDQGTIATRARLFGAFLVFTGTALQLAAAIGDFLR